MTTDNFVMIIFYNINIKLWIFDPFSPKLFYNKINENYITQNINDIIDYIICTCKKKTLVVWNLYVLDQFKLIKFRPKWERENQTCGKVHI